MSSSSVTIAVNTFTLLLFSAGDTHPTERTCTRHAGSVVVPKIIGIRLHMVRHFSTGFPIAAATAVLIRERSLSMFSVDTLALVLMHIRGIQRLIFDHFCLPVGRLPGDLVELVDISYHLAAWGVFPRLLLRDPAGCQRTRCCASDGPVPLWLARAFHFVTYLCER